MIFHSWDSGPLRSSVLFIILPQCGSFPSRSNSIKPPPPIFLVSVGKLKLSVIRPHSRCRLLRAIILSVPVQHLGHNAEHFLLFLAVFPSCPTSFQRLCSSAQPGTGAQSRPFGQSSLFLQPSDHPPGSSSSTAASCNWQRLHLST